MLPSYYWSSKKNVCLVGQGASDEGVPGTRRSEEKDPTSWFHPYRFEQVWVTKDQFHHLFYKSQLIANTTYVIITNSGQFLFFFLSLLGFTVTNA